MKGGLEEGKRELEKGEGAKETKEKGGEGNMGGEGERESRSGREYFLTP